MTFREFTGKNVEEAIRSAMAEFSSDLGDLDIEILSQGSRGILGVGGEEARILAAPKSAIAGAETVRDEPTSEEPEPWVGLGGTDADAAIAGREGEPPDAGEQVADLERAERGRGRSRGGRGRNGFGPREAGSPPRAARGRGGDDGDRRGRERAERQDRPARAGRPPRAEQPPRADRPTREPSPFVPAKPLDELSETERASLDEGKAVLEELLRLMGLAASVEVTMGTETAKLNVSGEDLGVLIGRRGEKLASLQHLVNLIVGRREGQHHRIAVDIGNYRGRREDQLRDVAERAAKRVMQTGRIIQLEAMPAVERRIVHLALVENGRVRTQSVGVEPNRRIVVLPATQVKE